MSEPSGDNKGPKVDGGLKLLARVLLAVSSIIIFVVRGYISGSVPIILMVAVLCGLAIYSSSWRSPGYLAVAYFTAEFVCTLGPGSAPCEPLNGTRMLVVGVTAAALLALDLWCKLRKVLRESP